MKLGKDTYPPKFQAPKAWSWARIGLGAGLSSRSAPISVMKRYLTRGGRSEAGPSALATRGWPSTEMLYGNHHRWVFPGKSKSVLSRRNCSERSLTGGKDQDEAEWILPNPDNCNIRHAKCYRTFGTVCQVFTGFRWVFNSTFPPFGSTLTTFNSSAHLIAGFLAGSFHCPRRHPLWVQ